jgi:deoxyribose-phosphate aldolase
VSLRYDDLAAMIDHALLAPTLTWDELEAGCRLARAYGVASVCIMPYALARCAELLAGSPVAPSTTIGFPHGGQATAVKVAEADRAISDGGVELDMVVNVSLVRSGRWEDVRADIRGVTEAAHAAGRKVKVIFECCFLDDAQKIRLCEIASDLGCDWVKTSTGFGGGGATEADVALMRRHAAPHVQVKAAGGIRDLDGLLRFRDLGANRCGTSRTQDILDDLTRRLGRPAVDRAAAGVARATPPAGY